MSWSRNRYGVKDGAECYRTIKGVRWEWRAGDISLYRNAGVRCRKTPDGQGFFVHPDDDEKAENILTIPNQEPTTLQQPGTRHGE